MSAINVKIIFIALAATLLVFAITTTSASAGSTAIKVQAGRGNGTIAETVFVPSQVEIKSGGSVTWFNPTPVPEPHTITFVLDDKYMTDIITPFAVPNSTQFMALPNGSNSEPTIVPGKNGMNTVLSLNGRVYNSVVIDSSGSAKFLGPNSNYTINGNEKFVNSGFLLPKGQEQVFPGSGNSFTVTFENAGTYNYICVIHPYMTGKVIVK